MFTVSGGIKLMDFGIARQESFKDLTQAGAGVGTPAYMSPEQILGEKLDGRTDIWSLGVVLYQMLTGKKPFRQDDDHTVLHNIRVERPAPPRQLNAEIPRELERIVLRCLEKSSRDRYPVAQQLALALERFAATRLTMPHKVRLVSWLESLGELSPEQATAALPADGDDGLRAQWRSQELPGPKGPLLGIPPAGWVAAVSAVLFLTLLIVVLANWPNKKKPAPCPAPTAADAMTPGPPVPGPTFSAPASKQGGLRVNAHPWAHVRVDGKLRETTPFARPIPVAAGMRQVVLEHPKLGTRERVVTIKAGRVATLSVDLTASKTAPKRPAPRRSAPKRPATRGGK
jgi:serine/threonine-protein kinase